MVGLNLFDEVSDKYYSQLKAKLRDSILIKRPAIGFKDIAGNDYAKQIIRETFITPETHPKLFGGKLRPWQSILLYGVSILCFIDSFVASWSWQDHARSGCLPSHQGNLLLG